MHMVMALATNFSAVWVGIIGYWSDRLPGRWCVFSRLLDDCGQSMRYDKIACPGPHHVVTGQFVSHRMRGFSQAALQGRHAAHAERGRRAVHARHRTKLRAYPCHSKESSVCIDDFKSSTTSIARMLSSCRVPMNVPLSSLPVSQCLDLVRHDSASLSSSTAASHIGSDCISPSK